MAGGGLPIDATPVSLDAIVQLIDAGLWATVSSPRGTSSPGPSLTMTSPWVGTTSASSGRVEARVAVGWRPPGHRSILLGVLRRPGNRGLITQRSLVQIQPAQRSTLGKRRSDTGLIPAVFSRRSRPRRPTRGTEDRLDFPALGGLISRETRWKRLAGGGEDEASFRDESVGGIGRGGEARGFIPRGPA